MHWLKLTYILQIKLINVSESYISHCCYITQVKHDIKAVLFKLNSQGREEVSSFENKLQNVKSANVKGNLITWAK